MCIYKHIKHDYYQCCIWVSASSNESMFLDPLYLYYGYTLDDNETLVADISSSELPDDFPLPCTCGKCARDNVCPCRIKSIGCCQHCKCKNPNSRKSMTDDFGHVSTL